MDIMVQELNKPHNTHVLQNMLGLAGLIGSIDVDALKELTEKANNGLKEATDSEAAEGPSNIFQLMKIMKDPEINRSMGMMISFLKGMGKEES